MKKIKNYAPDPISFCGEPFHDKFLKKITLNSKIELYNSVEIHELKIENRIFHVVYVDEIPEFIKDEFNEFFYGQTGLLTEDNKFCVYSHDWVNFKNYLLGLPTFFD